MKGGFKESPLRLNAGLGAIEKWDESAIKDRALRLADVSIQIWDTPALSNEILDNYRKKSESKSIYSIDDHPHLSSGPVREIFEAFRKTVRALDPIVTEEFLKLYVAYKAETNFVDVIPQKKRLRLTLNLSFNEIADPKGMCRDVTALGRWGNGDVEIDLSSLSDLPYVIGLVRQAFERQMGSTNPE